MREPRSRPCALQVLHAHAIPEPCSSALCPLRSSRQILGILRGPRPPLCAPERARGTHAYIGASRIACSTLLEPRSSALPCVQCLFPSIIPAFPTDQYLRSTPPPGIPSFQGTSLPPPPCKGICVASPFLTPCAHLVHAASLHNT